MSRAKDWSEEEINEILQKYKNNVSQCQLAKDYNCSRTAIYNLLKKQNVHIRNVQEANGKIIPEEQVRKIIDNYVLLKMGASSAGKEFGLSQKKVESLLKENGIKLRNYIESKQVIRKYEIDDNFFKTQTHDMAYLLGFIAADGNVAKEENRISIEVHEKDKELLEKIANITKNSRPLKTYIHKHENGTETPTIKFDTWSHEWKQDLAVYNIVPNKTFILQPPTFLNEEYYISYIKGYFDGDGSVYLRNGRLSISISGASKKLIVWIKDILANKFGIPCNMNFYLTPNKEHCMHRISYDRQEDIERLYQLWYVKYLTTLFLQRKKDIFENFLKK